MGRVRVLSAPCVAEGVRRVDRYRHIVACKRVLNHCVAKSDKLRNIEYDNNINDSDQYNLANNIYRGRNENIDKFFWKYRQIFLKISTNFSKNIDKFFKKYRQIIFKISTKFSKNIDNFFNKYNLAYWFYICDLALKIVFWLK